MKINRQFQALHTPGESTQWVLKQLVERDICLLYHQLAEYSCIMGDLYYGDVFALPYWEYLNFPDDDPDQRKFIREGCLVMILAMASECLDGSGSFLVPHTQECLTSLGLVHAEDPDSERLVQTVRLALESIRDSHPEPPELGEAYAWVHRRFVRTYFAERAEAFRTDPYFAERSP